MRGAGRQERCGCDSPNLWQAGTATEPADGQLNNPAHGLDRESVGMVGACDDFDRQVWHGVGDAVLEDRPGIGFVCEASEGMGTVRTNWPTVGYRRRDPERQRLLPACAAPGRVYQPGHGASCP